MTNVVLNVPMEALPELLRRAVAAVPRASLVEVLPDEALVARRTSFAAGAPPRG